MPEEASQAKRIVARRPVESCTTVRRTAPVAVEVASPTPTPKVSFRRRRGNLGGRLCWREGGPLDFKLASSTMARGNLAMLCSMSRTRNLKLAGTLVGGEEIPDKVICDTVGEANGEEYRNETFFEPDA